MNKKHLKKLIIIAVVAIFVLILAILGLKNLKVDDFHPASVIFVLDSSASNQKMLPKQVKYLKQLCSILDPEDKIKIIKVSQSAYLIYEGSPFNYSEITNSIQKYTAYNPNEYGTNYKEALKKAFLYSRIMKKDGYIPSVVILGDLEDEGNAYSKLSWTKLANNISDIQKVAPDFSMIFLYAHPEKLDYAKEQLIQVLGEDKLIISSGETISKVSSKILRAIGR